MFNFRIGITLFSRDGGRIDVPRTVELHLLGLVSPGEGHPPPGTLASHVLKDTNERETALF